jgi:hypothetical protein
MEELYNVYFAGQVLDGHDLRGVRDKLAKVFNADPATLDKLFSGNPQLIKRDCDKATALKYKDAMQRAGAVPIIKATESTAAIPPTVPARAMTAAERIAALAAAPDDNRYSSAAAGSATKAPVQDTAAEPGSIVLAPPGTEVLREDERAPHIRREIDTSGLAVDTAATRLSDEPPPAPAAPDTRHLSMGDVGEFIPNLPSLEIPLSPDIDGLALSAAGTDFSDCAAPEPEAASLDLSALAVMPAGGPLLEEQYRRRESGAAPSTDHISLQD